MDLNQLKIFRAIARKDNISQAARDLFISQQSISRTLKQLELELGVELFDRQGRHLSLNRYGKILLHYSDVANHAMQDAEATLRRQIELREQTVIIIFRALLGNTTAALAPFIHDHPEIQLHIAKDPDANGDQDLELISTDGEIDDPDYSYICDNPWLLFVPTEHKLTNIGTPLTFGDLREEYFVSCSLVEPDEIFLSTCRMAGFKPSMRLQSPQIWGILNAVADGLGVSYAPGTTWLNTPYKGITPLPLSGINRTQKLYIKHCKSNQTKAVKLFAQHLANHLIAARNRLPNQ